MANDLIPYFRPGQDITALATAAVTGKRFVRISGNRTSGPGLSATAEGSVYRAQHCDAALHPVGVSKYDAPLNGMFGIARGGIVPVTSGAAITAGQAVQSDANGKAIALAAGPKAGVAMSGVGGADLDVEVALNV